MTSAKVAVAVGVRELVAVAVRVKVGVAVRVKVAVLVGVEVIVGVRVMVGAAPSAWDDHSPGHALLPPGMRAPPWQGSNIHVRGTSTCSLCSVGW